MVDSHRVPRCSRQKRHPHSEVSVRASYHYAPGPLSKSALASPQTARRFQRASLSRQRFASHRPLKPIPLRHPCVLFERLSGFPLVNCVCQETLALFYMSFNYSENRPNLSFFGFSSRFGEVDLGFRVSFHLSAFYTGEETSPLHVPNFALF